MNTLETAPLTITPEAAARVAELGMQAALEEMLERARQTIPRLERLSVILEPAYDTGDDPYLTIQAFVPRRRPWDDRSEKLWGQWKGATFSPEIGRHIALLVEVARRGSAGLSPLQP